MANFNNQKKGDSVHSVGFSENKFRLSIRFFYGNTVCCAIASNLTSVNMIIHSRTCYPVNSVFDALFFVDNKVMKIPVKVKGFLKTDISSHSMAVEIASMKREYMKLINSFSVEEVCPGSAEKSREKILA